MWDLNSHYSSSQTRCHNQVRRTGEYCYSLKVVDRQGDDPCTCMPPLWVLTGGEPLRPASDSDARKHADVDIYHNNWCSDTLVYDNVEYDSMWSCLDSDVNHLGPQRSHLTPTAEKQPKAFSYSFLKHAVLDLDS